jgi:hypothetical protein
VPLHYRASCPVSFLSVQALLHVMEDASTCRGRWRLLKRAWGDLVLRHCRWELPYRVLMRIRETSRQSKLSQQELAELQKATHFDKKELQQWYKGLPDAPSLLPIFSPVLAMRNMSNANRPSSAFLKDSLRTALQVHSPKKSSKKSTGSSSLSATRLLLRTMFSTSLTQIRVGRSTLRSSSVHYLSPLEARWRTN